jgi:4-hydroxybenzoate polyprenyltransferase
MLLNLARLIRFDTCLLTALSIFVPLLFKTGDIIFSSTYSLPLFSIVASGFIINDIQDAENDKINHPKRVLPSKQVTLHFAVVTYFILLGTSLIAIKELIPLKYIYIYAVYLILITNYNYIKAEFPYLKIFFVSTVMGLHLFILSQLVSISTYFSIGIIFYIFARELLMDINDLKGDGKTLVKLLGVSVSVYYSFLFQFLSIALITFYVANNKLDYLVMALSIITIIFNYFFWKIETKRKQVIRIMKIQLVLLFVMIL